MFLRLRKRRQSTVPAASESTAPADVPAEGADPVDGMADTPPSASPSGVPLDTVRSTRRGKAIESKRGSHR